MPLSVEFQSFFGPFIHVGSRGCEWTNGSHGDIIVGILSLWAASLVQTVPWRMLIELCVHVPTDLLCSSLGIVELLLWLALECLKFVLKNFQFLLGSSLSACRGRLIWANLSGLRRDCDH